jgi:hypothetical protein
VPGNSSTDHKPLRQHSDRAVEQPALHSGTQVRQTSTLNVRLCSLKNEEYDVHFFTF